MNGSVSLLRLIALFRSVIVCVVHAYIVTVLVVPLVCSYCCSVLIALILNE